jgi:hypothetical protein
MILIQNGNIVYNGIISLYLNHAHMQLEFVTDHKAFRTKV